MVGCAPRRDRIADRRGLRRRATRRIARTRRSAFQTQRTEASPASRTTAGMTRYRFTPQATDDLLDIWNFIAQDNPDAADRVEAAVFRACDLLRSEEHTSELQSPCNLVCR